MSDDTRWSRLDDELAHSLLDQRTLVMGGVLDEALGNRLCLGLFVLSAQDPTADIHLWINSPGGSVPAMLAIRDVMTLIPNDVSTLAMGIACSAGQFLLSAGATGKRYALPHARVLLHQGSAGIGGTAMDIAIQAVDLKHTRDTVLGLISHDTGQDLATVERDSRRDRWYTAEEARDYGFVDHIVSSVDDVRTPRPRPLGLGGAAMTSYAVPYVTTQTNRGERTVDVYSRLLADRIIYLGTPIDDGVANTVIAQLIHLESESPEAPINLYLNSPGGSIPAMLAIYDAMQFVRPAIETTCVGQAVATAAVLLAGGAKGRRQILRHGRVVLHAPATEGRGTIPDLILEAEEVERVRSLLEELLAHDTGKSPQQVRDDTERDLVLTAHAAVEYGVVDAVITERDVSGQAARQTGP